MRITEGTFAEDTQKEQEKKPQYVTPTMELLGSGVRIDRATGQVTVWEIPQAKEPTELEVQRVRAYAVRTQAPQVKQEQERAARIEEKIRRGEKLSILEWAYLGQRVPKQVPEIYESAEQARASKTFYEQLGYPQHAGQYAPFTIPAGYQVETVTETKTGLEVTFKPIYKPWWKPKGGAFEEFKAKRGLVPAAGELYGLIAPTLISLRAAELPRPSDVLYGLKQPKGLLADYFVTPEKEYGLAERYEHPIHYLGGAAELLEIGELLFPYPVPVPERPLTPERIGGLLTGSLVAGGVVGWVFEPATTALATIIGKKWAGTKTYAKLQEWLTKRATKQAGGFIKPGTLAYEKQLGFIKPAATTPYDSITGGLGWKEKLVMKLLHVKPSLPYGEISVPIGEKMGVFGREAIPKTLPYTDIGWELTQAPRMGGVMITKVPTTSLGRTTLPLFFGLGENLIPLSEVLASEQHLTIKGSTLKPLKWKAVEPVGSFTKTPWQMAGEGEFWFQKAHMPTLTELMAQQKLLPFVTQTQVTRMGILPYVPSMVEKGAAAHVSVLPGLGLFGFAGVTPKKATGKKTTLTPITPSVPIIHVKQKLELLPDAAIQSMQTTLPKKETEWKLPGPPSQIVKMKLGLTEQIEEKAKPKGFLLGPPGEIVRLKLGLDERVLPQENEAEKAGLVVSPQLGIVQRQKLLRTTLLKQEVIKPLLPKLVEEPYPKFKEKRKVTLLPRARQFPIQIPSLRTEPLEALALKTSLEQLQMSLAIPKPPPLKSTFELPRIPPLWKPRGGEDVSGERRGLWGAWFKREHPIKTWRAMLETFGMPVKKRKPRRKVKPKTSKPKRMVKRRKVKAHKKRKKKR